MGSDWKSREQGLFGCCCNLDVVFKLSTLENPVYSLVIYIFRRACTTSEKITRNTWLFLLLENVISGLTAESQESPCHHGGEVEAF